VPPHSGASSSHLSSGYTHLPHGQWRSPSSGHDPQRPPWHTCGLKARGGREGGGWRCNRPCKANTRAHCLAAGAVVLSLLWTRATASRMAHLGLEAGGGGGTRGGGSGGVWKDVTSKVHCLATRAVQARATAHGTPVLGWRGGGWQQCVRMADLEAAGGGGMRKYEWKQSTNTAFICSRWDAWG
jgi:hypothetical protein